MVDREKLVEFAYQRGVELNLNNKKYLKWITKFFDQEYREDIGTGDITSKAILIRDRLGKAILKAEQSGIVGGVSEVSWFYRKHGLKVEIYAQEGGRILRGDTILEVYGSRKDILATERVGLNILQRMSGIATETRRLVDILNGYGARIAATRKTPLKYLDKKAVFLGGGLTHRLGLWDSILIKDNHLEALKIDGVKNYVEKALSLASSFIDKVRFIEIETTNQEDAMRAARKFKQLKLKKPCIIMLDNVKTDEIAQLIETLKSENIYEHILLEASGNITRGNVKDYAETGIDVISLGYITHSTKAFNIGLEMTL